MGTITYLQVVNEVLADTNEVPLTSTTFADSRGFHSFVKNAVNRALMDIVNYCDEWPWLANVTLDPNLSIHTNELYTERRQAVYTLDDHSHIDWDSFVIEDLQNKDTYPLESIQLEAWKEYRAEEAKLGRPSTELDRPRFIYRTPDQTGFAVSPVPDKAYRIRYISFKVPTFLSSYDDTIPFPDRFYNVLVSRARYYAWGFRENNEQQGYADKDYKEGLADMKRHLIRTAFQVMRPR